MAQAEGHLIYHPPHHRHHCPDGPEGFALGSAVLACLDSSQHCCGDPVSSHWMPLGGTIHQGVWGWEAGGPFDQSEASERPSPGIWNFELRAETGGTASEGDHPLTLLTVNPREQPQLLSLLEPGGLDFSLILSATHRFH